MATWLVTGAAGFLGMNAGAFLQDKVRVVGQTRSPRSLSVYDELVAVDLRDAPRAAELIRKQRPDVVLHAAAISGHETCAQDPEQAFAVNVEATRAIAEAAQESGARLVYISTDAVFSGREGNYRETDPTEPFSYYGESKLLGEAAVRESAENSLIVRTNFFGWSHRGDRSVLEFFVNSLRAGTAVRGYPDFVVTSIYAQSLLQAIWDLETIGTTGLLHVASSDALSKYDYGLAVAREFGLDSELISPLPAEAGAHTSSRSRDISLNTDLFASIRGEPAQTQRAGIANARIDESRLRSNFHPTDHI